MQNDSDSGVGGTGGNLRDFLHMIVKEDGKPTRGAASFEMHVRQVLGVDSPQNSLGSSASFLPNAIMNIIADSLGAQAVVVAVLHPANRLLHNQKTSRLAETIVSTPKDIIPEAVSFSQAMLSSLTGQVLPTENLQLPFSLRNCLGTPPILFQALPLHLQDYQGALYALWTDSSKIPPTATIVFSRAARSLPLLLANRASARKIERIGRQFDAILKRMPQAVVFVDDELAQVVVNPAAANLLELPDFGEVDPVKVASAMRQLAERSGSKDDLQKWFSMVASTADSVIHEEWHLSHPRRVLRVESYPVTSAVNSAHGRLWMFEDLTLERDAREAIAAANHAKSNFLATMSHELRTPMTGVLGMLELLKLTELESEQVQLVRVMQSSAEGLMTTINNILDFCKMEAGRLMLEDIVFQVQDILQSIQNMFERDVQKKQLQFRVQQPPQRYQKLRGDPVRLKQIISNLVSNAIKFTSDCGFVTLSWHQRDPPQVMPAGAFSLDNGGGSGHWGREGTFVWSPGQHLNYADRAKTWPPRQLERVHSRFGARGPSGLGLDQNQKEPEKWTREDYEMASSDSQENEQKGRYSSPGNDSRENEENQEDEMQPRLFQNFSFNIRGSTPPPHGWNPLERSVTVGTTDLSRMGHLGSRHSSRSTENLSERPPPPPCCQRCGNPVEPPPVEVSSSGEPSTSARGRPPLPPLRVNVNSSAGEITSGPGRPEKEDHSKPEYCSECNDECSRERLGEKEGEVEGEREREPGWEEGPSGSFQDDGKEEKSVWFRIIVADTGCGMSREHLSTLFDGSKTPERWREQEGTGLGLAICKGLLSLMGGFIWADSQPGKGSRFYVAVPLLLAEGPNINLPPTTPENTLHPGKSTDSPVATRSPANPLVLRTDLRLNVLVAEDNKVNQLLIKRILKHYGHEVELVGDGKQALEAVQVAEYDMVLMDLQMPILDGISATKAIRALPLEVSKIPIYALTADAMASEIEESGMDGFLSKPIVWEKLSHVVDKVLAEKATRGTPSGY